MVSCKHGFDESVCIFWTDYDEFFNGVFADFLKFLNMFSDIFTLVCSFLERGVGVVNPGEEVLLNGRVVQEQGDAVVVMLPL